MSIKIDRIVVGNYQTNCYIIYDEEGDAVVIDTGTESDEILAFLEEKNLNLDSIILTHGHNDHIGGVNQLYKRYKPKIYLSYKDRDFLDEYGEYLDSIIGEIEKFPIEKIMDIQDGQKIPFKEYEFLAISTPGHTPGSICFLLKDILFSGDMLFKGSIGRTDFPGSNSSDMIQSLGKIMKLPDNIKVLPGHGFKTTIGEERNTNPFVKMYLT